jgi:PKD repeat protein
MPFTGNFMCTSFKVELMRAIHNFTASTGNTFKLAMYTNSASFTAATTAYTTTNEVTASGSYSAGGGTLTNITPTSSGTTAFTDFADLSFTTATITARGALIYNDTATGDPTVVVLDFGSDKTSTSGTFQIIFPAADASNAIIRIA